MGLRAVLLPSLIAYPISLHRHMSMRLLLSLYSYISLASSPKMVMTDGTRTAGGSAAVAAAPVCLQRSTSRPRLRMCRQSLGMTTLPL